MVTNVFLVENSAVSHPKLLCFDLTGEIDKYESSEWIENWMWNDGMPFKFRILGKFATYYTWKLLDSQQSVFSFYVIYIIWSGIWLSATTIPLYFFIRIYLRNITEDERILEWAPLVGTIFFLISAPILFGFKFPVHTRPNDFLGNFLMILGLLFIQKNQIGRFCALACVAVFCRETTLLIPFIYLIAGNASYKKRLAISVIPVLIWAAYRIMWYTPYDPVSPTIQNFYSSLESLGFVFVSFGFLWLSGYLGYKDLHQTNDHKVPKNLLIDSALPALLLVMGIALFLARIREIRILFVLFPYVITFSAYWVVKNTPTIPRILKETRFWTYSLIALLVCITGASIFYYDSAVLITFYRRWFANFYGGFGGGWIPHAFTYLFVTFLMAIATIVQKRRPSPPL